MLKLVFAMQLTATTLALPPKAPAATPKDETAKLETYRPRKPGGIGF